MLEHQKIVLQNVSYNKSLFKKELCKSIAWLNSAELDQFRLWVREKFWQTHGEIIQEVFYPGYNLAS
ncbi:MAG: hypothetical protein MI922_21695 [Bacteroidales bacterium]|nr:hypothetical protein [Bacteroidales bacterium]